MGGPEGEGGDGWEVSLPVYPPSHNTPLLFLFLLLLLSACEANWTPLHRLFYLTKIIGYDKTVAQQLINEKSTRRGHRSPSRHRE